MCNFYMMYYTDPSTGTSFYACAGNEAPELVNQIPAGSDVTLPPNPSLDDMAEGISYEGKPVDLVVDTLSHSNSSLSRNDDFVIDDSYPSKDDSSRPSYDGSLLENTHRARWESNQRGQGSQYRQRNPYLQGDQYAPWTQRKHHAPQDDQYAQPNPDESAKEEEDEQEAMKQRIRNQHPYADDAEGENPHQDSSSISTRPIPAATASVPATVAPSAGTSTQLIASVMESVIRSSLSSKLDDWMLHEAFTECSA